MDRVPDEPPGNTVVVETDKFIKVHVEIPPQYPDIAVDEVEGGVLVRAEDGDALHCFVPLPPTADIGRMQAMMQDDGLELMIPKNAEEE